MANYQNRSSGLKTKEHFTSQNFDTSGQIADLLNLFPDYKTKLTPAM